MLIKQVCTTVNTCIYSNSGPFKECNDGLTYNETLVQAPKDMTQDNHLPQEKVHRQVSEHSTQEC